MIESGFDLRALIRVQHLEPQARDWPIASPFDLRFKEGHLTDEQSAAISGTGTYLIAGGAPLPDGSKEVVYIGRFQPRDGKIIAVRWGRHLQTITARGYNIGLGGKPERAEDRLAKLLLAVEHPGLREVLQVALVHDRRRYRDTGNTTTANRLRFASENWDSFKDAGPDQILNGLTFLLLRMRRAATEAQAKQEISRIEKLALDHFKPCCNDEYDHAKHAAARGNNTIPNLVAAVRQAMIQVTNQGPTHCVELAG